MATLRSGKFGDYYGSVQGTSEPLTEAEMNVNAVYIGKYLSNEGWNINAISAILGNMQAESTINPGRWQSDTISFSLGFGLVQWTPYTKYNEWCLQNNLADPSEMDNNLKRILYELENNIQWIATSSYNFSFKEFSTSNRSVSDLAKSFLLNYERPADQSESVQNYRAELAEAWYNYLENSLPLEPITPITRKRSRKYKFILFQSSRRRNQWIRNS